MKKLLGILLLFSLCLSVFACDNTDKTDPDDIKVGEDEGEDKNCKKHDYGIWDIVKYPTKDAWGQNKRTCTKCGKTEYQEIPFGSYSVGLVYVSNGDGTCDIERVGTCDDTEIIIPPTNSAGEKVTGIREFAFYQCVEVTSFVLPDSLVSISAGAFSACYKLTSIVIPDGVAFIGNSGFYDCKKLNAIVLPAAMKTIGYNCFDLCNRMSRIFYSGSESDWKNITIHTGNEPLHKKGILVCNYVEK